MKLHSALSIIALAIQLSTVTAQPEIELQIIAQQLASGKLGLLTSSSSLRGSGEISALSTATQTLQRKIKGKAPKGPKEGRQKRKDDDKCKESVDLEQFPQWQEEVGYWVGEYSFYGPNGEANVSPNWNYRYDNYKGFITGNVQG